MTNFNELVSQYITDLFAIQDEPLRQAREEALTKGLPAISIRPEEGRFLQFLVRTCGARKAIEIGTLIGYSGIWIARGLLPGGKLISLEREPLHAELARQNFAAAGLLEKVEIRVGIAKQVLPSLKTESPFDFIFIDADKPNLPSYFEWALDNLRSGGVMAVHNALRGGRVTELQPGDESVQIMRTFNQCVANETRLISTIYPGGDGMLVAVKVK